MSPKFKRRNSGHGWFKLSLLIFDMVIVLASSIIALLLRNMIFIPEPGDVFSAIRIFYLPSFLILFLGLYIADAFNFDAMESGSDILLVVLKGVFIGVVLASAIEYSMRIHFFPRGYMFLFAVVSVPFLYFERRVVASGWQKLASPDRILVIGNVKDVDNVLRRIKRREYNIFSSIVGVLVPDSVALEGRKDIEGVPILSSGHGDLDKVISKFNINRIIVVSPMDHREFINKLHNSSNSDVRIEVLPGIYEILIGRPDYSLLADVPLIQLTRDNPPEWYLIVKRIMDIVISVLLFIITLPMMLIIAAAIKLTSKGPVFHRQTRVGKDFKPFTIHKFRTMKVGSERENREVTDPNDPRITPVGRILRKYHLDELPQLWNVIKGDMSLVGPRPEKVEFFQKYLEHVPGYRERQKVKPGLTGLAQVWGDHTIDPEFKLKYDLIYIYNRNLLLDIMILLRTIRVVFRGTGI